MHGQQLRLYFQVWIHSAAGHYSGHPFRDDVPDCRV